MCPFIAHDAHRYETCSVWMNNALVSHVAIKPHFASPAFGLPRAALGTKWALSVFYQIVFFYGTGLHLDGPPGLYR